MSFKPSCIDSATQHKLFPAVSRCYRPHKIQNSDV